MKSNLHVVTGFCIWAASFSATAAVPFTFQSGTPAQASQVNQNFQNLDQRVNSAIGTLTVVPVSTSSDTSTGVASTSCASDSIAISASCGCNNVGGSRNFGVLFSCEIAGNGVVGGCFSDAATFDFTKPPPQVTVTAKCLGGLHLDGTPLPTLLFPLKAFSQGSEETNAMQRLQELEQAHRAAIQSLSQ